MKRLIFALLYEDGQFIQSRNFNRQRVGTIDWLLNNYDFLQVSRSLDEIMLVDISKNADSRSGFLDAVRNIASRCFIPITVGGKITEMDDAQTFYACGADKVFINHLLTTDADEVRRMINHYGSQAIVAGVNYREKDGQIVYADSAGTINADVVLERHLTSLEKLGVGEVVLQGIHRDGTGFGIDQYILEHIPENFTLPLILMGGIGNSQHMMTILSDDRTDAIVTANLLNFIGDAFQRARQDIIENGFPIPEFNLGIEL